MKTWFWICSYCHDMIPVDVIELKVDPDKLRPYEPMIQHLDDNELSPSHTIVRDHYIIYHGISRESGGVIEGEITDVEGMVN
jgi:hypothetical protein